jgi:asparagine synthase (glutamine-hydrolysing)
MTEHLRGYFDGMDSADPLNRMLWAEFKGIFPDQVLEFSDKLSMAHNLELRASYLDHEFVEFASSISGNLKIKDGVSKYILKKAASCYLPAEVVDRGKEGFILPITEWFYWSLRPYVEGMLSKENLSKHGFFNFAYVKQLIDEFYNNGYDYRRGNKLLSLIAFQVWHDLYIGNRSNV